MPSKYIISASKIKQLRDLDARVACERKKFYSLSLFDRKVEEQSLIVQKYTNLRCDLLEEIDKIISQHKGSAKSRTIDASQICWILNEIEDRLFQVSSKKDAIGTKVIVDVHAQRFPRSYRYVPKSTKIEFILTSSGWACSSIWRDFCTRNPAKAIKFEFSEPSARNMVARMSNLELR